MRAVHTGEPHRWYGDIALISGRVDCPGEMPEREGRLQLDGDRLYDLGMLGWTFVAVDEAPAIPR